MYMSERQAAIAAKKIYARHRAGEITDNQALDELDKISPFFSTTQFIKHGEFMYGVQHNPNMFRKPEGETK